MTATTTLSEASRSTDVFSSLTGACSSRGLDSISGRLSELRTFLDGDMSDIERALGDVGGDDTPVHQSARHLLELSGKRLRPMCVALASRVGQGFTQAARKYAVAVELVHSATLLHDDVVDLGDRRRGAETARVIYGNAASIFGGDWLLAEALCRIQEAGIPGVMERMLEIIKEMVAAESLQLAQRGSMRADAADYFRIISGKTASLFRWAMFAGARAGDVGGEASMALETYGQHLGVAFQLVDDVLDFAGDPESTGKSLLTDLREGKMTYPLILAVERDRELKPILEAFCADEGTAPPSPEIGRRVARVMSEGRVVEDCLSLATRFCDDAVKSLSPLPRSLAREALEGIALSAPQRRK